MQNCSEQSVGITALDAYGSSSSHPPVVSNQGFPVRGAFPIPAWITRGIHQREHELVEPRRVGDVSQRRMELLVDEVSSSNARLVSNVSLLRASARDVAQRRNWLQRVLIDGYVQPFTWTSPEGDGSRYERSEVLRSYIDRVVVDANEIELRR